MNPVITGLRAALLLAHGRAEGRRPEGAPPGRRVRAGGGPRRRIARRGLSCRGGQKQAAKATAVMYSSPPNRPRHPPGRVSPGAVPPTVFVT